MQDEGSDGYGLAHHAAPANIPGQGTLIGLQAGGTKDHHLSALAAVRWIDRQPGQPVKLGVERIGTRPRMVALYAVDHLMSESIFSMVNAPADSLPTPCIFLPAEEDDSRLSSTLVVGDMDIASGQMYDLLDGNYIYRIRVTREQDRSHDWVRLKFNILTRRHIEGVQSAAVSA